MRVSEKKYLMDLAKDIVIAKLSSAAPNLSNKDSGNSIAEMYEAIYDKAKDIYFTDNSDDNA